MRGRVLLLIAPEGIEIWLAAYKRVEVVALLIAPEGIEIFSLFFGL